MEIIAEITRPGFAKLSIGDYSLCPLSEGSQGGVREAAVAAWPIFQPCLTWLHKIVN
jgi:hypothetical protein